VIIPSNHDYSELQKIVYKICNQTVKPDEIVIVDSSTSNTKGCSEFLSELCRTSGIDLLYVHRKKTFPGKARNIGLAMATSEIVAFIDVDTIPRDNWLEESIKILVDKNSMGVWGSTSFTAVTPFEKIVRDGFFGVLPLKTLPGGVFKRDVFYKAGQFIDWVRAGEDTDLMLRLELFKIRIASSSITLIDYVGLKDLNFNKLINKWYRNYSMSNKLPHFFPLKILLWMILYPLLILIAFNWNYLIADWEMASPFYIGHVTKISTIIPILIYVLLRGIILPFQRGVKITQLIPFRFIAITLICFLADLIKVLVFTLPLSKKTNIINSNDNI
jgi:glycosyltransferase involved in cell wall biosynthesis